MLTRCVDRNVREFRPETEETTTLILMFSIQKRKTHGIDQIHHLPTFSPSSSCSQHSHGVSHIPLPSGLSFACPFSSYSSTLSGHHCLYPPSPTLPSADCLDLMVRPPPWLDSEDRVAGDEAPHRASLRSQARRINWSSDTVLMWVVR